MAGVINRLAWPILQRILPFRICIGKIPLWRKQTLYIGGEGSEHHRTLEVLRWLPAC
jgi:hypothetical protein